MFFWAGAERDPETDTMSEHKSQLLFASLEGLMSHDEIESFHARYLRPRGCLLNLVIFFGCFADSIGLLTYLEDRVSHSLFVRVAIITLVLTVLSAIVPVTWLNRSVRKRMMAQLLNRGMRPLICLNCEYNLKGSTSDHCPECGAALAPAREDAVFE